MSYNSEGNDRRISHKVAGFPGQVTPIEIRGARTHQLASELTRTGNVITAADWIVDLGPEGGKDGGAIVAEGTPETVAAHHATSHTGRYLQERLRPSQSKRTGDPQAAE